VKIRVLQNPLLICEYADKYTSVSIICYQLSTEQQCPRGDIERIVHRITRTV